MKKKIIALFLCLALVLLLPIAAEATPTYRYTTLKKVCLREKAGGKVVYQVKRNTKLTVIKTGKKWVRVEYKDQRLSVKKKYTSLEKLTSKKRSRYYINYLHTKGPVYWKGRKFTYYTSRLLPIWKLPVPGLHLDKDGFFCDKWDYIVLGSNTCNRTQLIATPFGKFGKVYDAGYVGPYLYDCATNW